MNNKYEIDENIEEVCEKYTQLTSKEILYLKEKAEQIVSDEHFNENDVFIDVRNALTGEAIVVCHRRPYTNVSLYKERVVGKIAYRRDEPGPLRTLETAQTSINLHARSQEGLLIKQTTYPIKYNNKTIAVFIAEEDLSNDIKAHPNLNSESELIENNDQRYKDIDFLEHSISNYIDDAILIFDENGYLYHHNKAAERYYKEFGYLNKIEGLHYNNLALDLMTFERILSIVKAGDYESLKCREIKFGHCFFNSKIIFLPTKGIVIQTMKDITDQKLKESRVKEDLITIQEIHHRVKNNLQTVVSLLRLQARRVESREAKKVLNESVNRVLSIAATHELLSKQKEDDIQLKIVLDAVFLNLSRFYAERNEVELRSKVDPTITLSSNRAVTIALIMNELVQNCYDHAFVGEHDNSDMIIIDIKQECNLILINISDNGKGFDFDEIKQHNLGLQIVTSFVQSKLKGIIVVDSNDEGTKIKITFKNKIGNS